MLEDEDEYFAKEDEVFNEFIRQINEALKIKDVIADATHLNKKSRLKTLNRVDGFQDLRAIYLDVPLDIAIERNATREGRAYVPEQVIINMHNSLTNPIEDGLFSRVLVVNQNGDVERIIMS